MEYCFKCHRFVETDKKEFYDIEENKHVTYTCLRCNQWLKTVRTPKIEEGEEFDI